MAPPRHGVYCYKLCPSSPARTGLSTCPRFWHHHKYQAFRELPHSSSTPVFFWWSSDGSFWCQWPMFLLNWKRLAPMDRTKEVLVLVLILVCHMDTWDQSHVPPWKAWLPCCQWQMSGEQIEFEANGVSSCEEICWWRGIKVRWWCDGYVQQKLETEDGMEHRINNREQASNLSKHRVEKFSPIIWLNDTWTANFKKTWVTRAWATVSAVLSGMGTRKGYRLNGQRAVIITLFLESEPYQRWKWYWIKAFKLCCHQLISFYQGASDLRMGMN